MKQDPHKPRVYFVKSNEAEYPDEVGIARLLFLRISLQLKVPESGLRTALTAFGGLPPGGSGTPPDGMRPPAMLLSFDFPFWNFRYDSFAEYREQCHRSVDEHLGLLHETWKRELAQEGYREIKPQEQAKTLDQDLRLLAEYWLLSRRPRDLIIRFLPTAKNGNTNPKPLKSTDNFLAKRQMDYAKKARDAAESRFWKAIDRAKDALGLKSRPEPIRSATETA
jgi:hypothetical protein